MDDKKEIQENEVKRICGLQKSKDGTCSAFNKPCFYEKSGCGAYIAEVEERK